MQVPLLALVRHWHDLLEEKGHRDLDSCCRGSRFPHALRAHAGCDAQPLSTSTWVVPNFRNYTMACVLARDLSES